jgi:hypothetical protein
VALLSVKQALWVKAVQLLVNLQHQEPGPPLDSLQHQEAPLPLDKLQHQVQLLLLGDQLLVSLQLLPLLSDRPQPPINHLHSVKLQHPVNHLPSAKPTP